jgi:hypothetical protein
MVASNGYMFSLGVAITVLVAACGNGGDGPVTAPAETATTTRALTLTPTATPTEEAICPPRPAPTEFPCGPSCTGSCVSSGISGHCRADIGPCFCDTEGPTRTATPICPTETPTPGP